MRRLHRVLAISLSVAPAFGAPLVFAAEQPRQLEGFTEIHVGQGVALQVSQGDRFRVMASSAQGALSDVTTVVQGHRLKIGRRSQQPSRGHRDEGYVVNVTLPALHAIHASGGSRVSGQGAIRGDVLALVLSQGARLDLALAVKDVHVRTHTGAQARVTGEGLQIDVQGHDGSRIDTTGFGADAVDAASEDGSDVRVAVARHLRAEASNGAHLTIVGNSSNMVLRASTGGDINILPEESLPPP